MPLLIPSSMVPIGDFAGAQGEACGVCYVISQDAGGIVLMRGLRGLHAASPDWRVIGYEYHATGFSGGVQVIFLSLLALGSLSPSSGEIFPRGCAVCGGGVVVGIDRRGNRSGCVFSFGLDWILVLAPLLLCKVEAPS